MKEISEQDLRHALGFAIGRVKFTPDKKRRIDETARDELVAAVLDHFKLCGWRVMCAPEPWHSVNYDLARRHR